MFLPKHCTHDQVAVPAPLGKQTLAERNPPGITNWTLAYDLELEVSWSQDPALIVDDVPCIAALKRKIGQRLIVSGMRIQNRRIFLPRDFPNCPLHRC
jgi:hypothetical protein